MILQSTCSRCKVACNGSNKYLYGTFKNINASYVDYNLIAQQLEHCSRVEVSVVIFN